MKDWIKQHPWRLEIVPLIMIIAAVIIGVAIRSQTTTYYREVWPEQTWLSNFLIWLAWMLVLWAGEMSANRQWVRTERRKTINYYPLLSVIILGFGGSALWAGENLAVRMLWRTLCVASILAQAGIELTRPFVRFQKPKEEPPTIEVKPGEPFYYREQHFNWGSWFLYMAVALLTLANAGGFSQTWWVNLSLGIPVIAAWAYLWKIVVITHEQVYSKSRFSRETIPMWNIESCVVVEARPEDTGNMRPWSPWFLKIAAGDGTHYLTLDHPETACRLIQTALAARAQSEEKP